MQFSLKIVLFFITLKNKYLLFRVALKAEDDFAPKKDRKGSVFATIGKALGTVKKKEMLKNLDFSGIDDDFMDGTLTISPANSNVMFKSVNKKPYVFSIFFQNFSGIFFKMFQEFFF